MDRKTKRNEKETAQRAYTCNLYIKYVYNNYHAMHVCNRAGQKKEKEEKKGMKAETDEGIKTRPKPNVKIKLKIHFKSNITMQIPNTGSKSG
jgi:hypothetical protein